MSGPVAGVVGGIWAGKQAGYDNVITLDVGGTSADIGLAQVWSMPEHVGTRGPAIQKL
jgi:N-methylhydantoinase A/oxoprolinase/acetone carboxylase beta subunit